MEFASSHIYISCPANKNQTEQPDFYRNHITGTMRNFTIGESPAPEEWNPANVPLYDTAEGGDPKAGHWSLNILCSATANLAQKPAPVYDNRSGCGPDTSLPTPGSRAAAQPLYDVPEGSGSYYDNRRASASRTGPKPAYPPPLPPPRQRHGQPPPLPPRPRNLNQVPDYVELIDSTPTKGPGHQSPPAVHTEAQATPDSQSPLMSDGIFLKHKKEELKGNVNVVLVNLGKLVDIKNVKPQTGTPVYCQNCSAGMSAFSKVQDTHAAMWTCEFCSQNNALDYRSSNTGLGDDQTYIQVPNPMTSVHIDDSLVVFCVDISGSMSVTFEVNTSSNRKMLYMSRLQAVQEAVIQSLDYLFQTSPGMRVALVTFNNEVTIYGDGLTTPRTLQDFELIDQNYLKKHGLQETLPHCILESRDALHRHIHLLQECGATALGPAALISIAMASQKPGSKVIICTDGRANTILGNLEDIKEDKIYQSSKLFYSHLAEYAVERGVIVSVLTIEGTDCRLAELGQLADKTGGKVNITNPASLYNEFQQILEDDIIATNVTTTFIVDDGLYFKYEDEISSKYVKHIGNITKDMEISFEFGIKESKLEKIQKKTALPFQLQIGFRLPDGRCAYRIITQEKPITNCRARKKDVEQEAIYEGWVQSMSPIYRGLSSKTQDAATAQPVYEALGTKRDRDSVVKSFTDDIANVFFQLKNAKKKMFKKPKFMVAL
ncbi:circularly permutated Ras protein 1-like isoform X2 [Heptranchias perlo]|uniref:circularly permutated Ras protein 1-like isoform X2 n=1 Tax=Heptranchias perlo TaxID=212740 RepID=UPI003559E98E